MHGRVHGSGRGTRFGILIVSVVSVISGFGVVSGFGIVTRAAVADDDEGSRRPPAPPVEWVMKALGVSADDTPNLTDDQRHAADEAGQRLVSLCPDCRPSTITEEGPCGWARVNRRIIRNAVVQGRSANEIVDTYVAVYGQKILSVSKDRGFAAASWAVPYAAAVLSLAFLFLLGRRLRQRTMSGGASGDVSTEPSLRTTSGVEGTDDDDQKVLSRELASLD